MRALSAAVLGCFVVSLARSAESQELQWAQNPTNLHWYGIPFFPSTWTAGEALAVQQGGHLATVRSSAENAWIQSNLSGFNLSGYCIGFNDIAVEGTFVWTSGAPVTYTNWSSGQPDNAGNQDASRIAPSSSWRWDDIAVTDPAYTPIVELSQLPQVGFTLPVSYATQNQPAYHAIGDVAGDGRPDLVVPNFASNTISVFPGTSGGGFGSPTTISTPSGPQMVAVSDFDGDGDRDIAVTTWDGHLLRVLSNNGSGSFSTGVDVPLVGRGHGIAVADLDGDGDVDIAVTTVDPQDRLLILRNNGNGTFAAPAVYPTGSRPLFVTARDFDADADVDLVVSNFDSDDIGLYRNQGDGTFTTSALIARGNGPGRVAISDFDFDGRSDLAIPNRFDHNVRIWWGTGSGAFTVGPTLVTGLEPLACISADMDGDGRDDLVTSCFATDSVAVYYARGSGNFAGPVDLFAGDGAAGIAAADLNGDGRVDLSVTANLAAKVVNLFKISRDCNSNGVDDPRDIQLGTSVDCNTNGIPDECDLAPGQPFDCDANAVIDSCEITIDPTLDLDHDGLLDECESAGIGFCPGDGSDHACPCDPGQAGAPGSGCRNSFGTGAHLIAVGNASVSADSVSLRASGVLPNAVGLFYQGTLQQNAGHGTLFGDGLLCVNGTIKRLGIRNAGGGNMAYGRDVPTDTPISIVGMVTVAPGGTTTRYYQLWYRDAVSFCTESTYNLSNGVTIVWQP